MHAQIIENRTASIWSPGVPGEVSECRAQLWTPNGLVATSGDRRVGVPEPQRERRQAAAHPHPARGPPPERGFHSCPTPLTLRLCMRSPLIWTRSQHDLVLISQRPRFGASGSDWQRARPLSAPSFRSPSTTSRSIHHAAPQLAGSS